MRISDKGLKLIQRFEGFRPDVYTCPAGKPTIGWGHALKDGEDFTYGVSKNGANLLLRDDIREFENYIPRVVDVPLHQSQFDALCSFVFNLGVRNFRDSTLLKMVNQGKHDEVLEQFPRWNKVKTAEGYVPLMGLTVRRKAELELYKKGTDAVTPPDSPSSYS